MSNTSNPHPAPAESHSTPSEKQPGSTRSAFVTVLVIFVVLVVLAVVGILRRSHNDTVLAERTDEMAPPTVNVAPAKLGSPVAEFVLPGNVTAYTDSPIYARTDGYLSHWYYDIGAHVKQGALLAEIATPELDQQLKQAEQELESAQATANNAQIQAKRYSDLVKSQAVSQQDTDTFVNQAASTAAAVRSAEANVQRVKELQSFEKVYAPFDGIITGRTVDTGQLISAGSGTQLFHMQALQTLRVYTNVPEVNSLTVKRGAKIALTFPEHPGKTYWGTLVRTADALDPGSRTLLVEIDIDNRSGELLPGSLAQVHFKTPAVTQTFVVPAAAVLFRSDGLHVGTVIKDGKGNTVAHLNLVTIGEDDGASIQITTGITDKDQVIQDPPDSLLDGQRVTVVVPTSHAQGQSPESSAGGN